MLTYLQDETKSCYKEARQRPLTRKQDGGTEYTVSQQSLELAKSKDQDVTVVVTFGAYTLVSKLLLKLLCELSCLALPEKSLLGSRPVINLCQCCKNIEVMKG